MDNLPSRRPVREMTDKGPLDGRVVWPRFDHDNDRYFVVFLDDSRVDQVEPAERDPGKKHWSCREAI